MIYQSGRSSSELIHVPVDTEKWDQGCGAAPAVDDYDINPWVGDRYKIWDVDIFPGTVCELRNGYSIVASRIRQDGKGIKNNSTMRSMFGAKWKGNLLVFKRAVRDSCSVVNITPREMGLIDVLVHR